MWMLAAHLRDGHVSIKAPQWVIASAGQAHANGLDFIRAYDPSLPEGLGVFVLSWPDGQWPPVPDGLDPNFEIPQLVEIEGVPYRTETQSTNLFLAPPGHGVELLLQWSDGRRTRHVLVARPVMSASEEPDEISMQDLLRASPAIVIQLDNILYQAHTWEHRILERQHDRNVHIDENSHIRVAWYTSISLNVKEPEHARDSALATVYAERARVHIRTLLMPDSGLDAEVVVLDFRNNNGGNFAGIAALLDALLETETVLTSSIQGRIHSRMSIGGAPNSPPLVVLVNAGTASAAELAASALQTLGGAVVVGVPTSGSVGAVVIPKNISKTL